MTALLPVRRWADVLPAWRDTLVGDRLAYHDLEQPRADGERAGLLAIACVDAQIVLRMPDRFAFVVRVPGANLAGADFVVSCCAAVRGVRAVALAAHSDCGMVDLARQRHAFVHGLVSRLSWTSDAADRHFRVSHLRHAIADPAQFAAAEAACLRARFPCLLVAPLFYDVQDGTLLQVAQP